MTQKDSLSTIMSDPDFSKAKHDMLNKACALRLHLQMISKSPRLQQPMHAEKLQVKLDDFLKSLDTFLDKLEELLRSSP